jgi:gliding motility-associated-like protein
LLTTTDVNGCQGTDSIRVENLNLPVANFDTLTLKTYCDQFSLQFNNTSLFATEFLWDFGNGQTSTAAEPSATWQTQNDAVVQNFPVRLIAISPFGCSDTMTVDSFVVIYDSPVAAFTATPDRDEVILLDDALIQFQELSSPAATLFYWSFGDGSTSTEPNPAHRYVNIGDYFVTFAATNPLGCSDTTVYGPVQIDVPLMFNVPNVLTPNGDGFNDELRVEGQGVDRVEMVVTDRWGSEVFSATTNTWNGRDNNGEVVAPGSYFLRWKATFVNGRTVEEVKQITIVL